MSQVKQAGVVKASYRYNAKGKRVSRADNATGAITGYTLYDEAGHWLGDYDANGATKQQAIWLGDAPVGLMVGAGVAQTLRYVQPDHLGTPRAVIDPSRNLVIWTWDAKGEAFGNNPPNQDPDQDGTAFVFDMRFPGQRFDAATGLNYNYFRDYDAATGRYVQSDPIGLDGGVSTYAYVANDPLVSSDPFGLDCVSKNGRVTCFYPDPNGPAFTLPSSADFPEKIGYKNDFWRYHNYHEVESIGCANPADVMQKLVQSPTPGSPNPATKEGARNNAVVLNQDNFVTSYLTRDLRTGRPLIVNITDANSLFVWGYVARTVDSANAHTYGEGTSLSQAPRIIRPLIPAIANDLLWGGQMRELISDCRCTK